MTKISITAPKTQLEEVVDSLHDLGLLHIDEYGGELETGSPGDEAEELSQLLVDVRSVLSKLPEAEETEEISVNEVEEKFEEVRSKVNNLIEEKENIKRQIEGLEEEKDFYKKLKGCDVDLTELDSSGRLGFSVASLDEKRFREVVDTDRFDIFEGKKASVVVFDSEVSEKVSKALSGCVRESFQIPNDLRSGRPESVVERIESEIEGLEEDLKNVEDDFESLGSEWGGRLSYVEDYLSERIEKVEAPLSFGTTDRAFICEGWVPCESFEMLEERVADSAEGKVHIQQEDGEAENAPVQHDNFGPVQPFESLTDLMAVPKPNEVDPSNVLFLTFPLFFGFMIGDFGYGLTTLAVFYGGYKLLDGGEQIFKSLMYASFATMLFGLAFGDAFGFMIFGEDSVLAAQYGLEFFSHIPVLFHRAHHLGKVFTYSAIIGLVHVNMGFLIGAYNEYSQHGVKEAVLEKGSWIALEIGAALWILQGPSAAVPVILLSVIGLALGEGVEGIVEIPSLMSNILSYLRIFGVSVAAVSLAAVVNSIADTAFAAGGLFGFAAGTLVLVVGHVFNTFIKIIEGFLQGIRLHYVEMFGKFYEGGGRKYSPFGSEGSK
ncbi:MAG: V-type ATP synthase subunit I [Candidatus Nanohalobium sp.]